MSQTALALRRIIRAIGSAPVTGPRHRAPRTHRSACIHTESTKPQVQPQDSTTYQRFAVADRAPSHDQVVDNLLSSIRAHLDDSPSVNPTTAENDGTEVADVLDGTADDAESFQQGREASALEYSNDRVVVHDKQDDRRGKAEEEVSPDGEEPPRFGTSPAKMVSSDAFYSMIGTPAPAIPAATITNQVRKALQNQSWRRFSKSIPPSATDAAVISMELKRRANELGPSILPEAPVIYPKASLEVLEEKSKRLEEKAALSMDHLHGRRDFEKRPSAKEWELALDIMKAITIKDPKAHTRIVQVITLPDDAILMWGGDTRQIIVTILADTGSQLQVREYDHVPRSSGNRWDAITLTGTPEQNNAACKLIVEKALIQVQQGTQLVSIDRFLDQSDSRPSKSKTDTGHGAASIIKPRTIWYSPLRGDENKIDIISLLEAAFKRIQLPPLQLSAAVELITSSKPLQQLRRISMHFGNKPASIIRADALEQLLCEPSNIANTTTETLARAWQRLYSARAIPSIRRIMAARDEYAAQWSESSFQSVSTVAMNQILQAAVLDKDIHFFGYTLSMMKERGLSANLDTWILLLDITQRLANSKSEETVLNHMRERGLLEDASNRLKVLPLQCASWLKQELSLVKGASEQLPAHFIPNFVAKISERVGFKSWVTVSAAARMFDTLLPHGHWQEAFEVCQFLGGLQKDQSQLHLLQRCIVAASRSQGRKADLVVDVLHRFSSLLGQASTFELSLPKDKQALCSRKEIWRVVRPVTGVSLSADMYEKLFSIAVAERSWNLMRVVWQHACCAGQVSTRVREQMHWSLLCRLKLTMPEILHLNEYQFWKQSYALFAVGIGKKTADRKTNKRQVQDCLRSVEKDMQAFGHVRPLHSLAEDAMAARRFDRQLWTKFERPGLRSGQHRKPSAPFRNKLNPAAEAMVVPVVAVAVTESLQSDQSERLARHERRL